MLPVDFNFLYIYYLFYNECLLLYIHMNSTIKYNIFIIMVE